MCPGSLLNFGISRKYPPISLLENAINNLHRNRTTKPMKNMI
ncbi:hypothetical protein MmTuc01_0016 [Methanosarcina mazei Tuc01]|uniref:Uncharacterized protein n=1 Tax=Methanosarcina mazei Tuc01 TaxID=1236903 RepID=M1PTM7_METMZ|nr:hypothetical protein MmTuc01_0016 [Methanosarcina mazei Tuc01]